MRSTMMSLPLVGMLCARLGAALPADPQSQQANLGFDPKTYLYFVDETWPKDRPTKLPAVSKRWESPLPNVKRPRPSGVAAEYHPIEPNHPSAWYERSPETDIPPDIPPPVETVNQMFRNLEREMNPDPNGNPAHESNLVRGHYSGHIVGTIPHDGYTMFWMWFNEQNYYWPGGRDEVLPWNTEVIRDQRGDLADNGRTLHDWLTYRLDLVGRDGDPAGTHTRYNGLFVYAPGSFAITYRLVRNDDPAAVMLFTEFGQQGQGQSHPGPRQHDNNPPPFTPFGSPVAPLPPPPPPLLDIAKGAPDNKSTKLDISLPTREDVVPDSLAVWETAGLIFLLVCLIPIGL